MPQREIKTYHGSKDVWVPNEFGELKYNPNMGYTGEGAQVFGKGFYQALDPNIALSNYAIPLSEDAGTKGALLENTTNPDLYYDTNLPLSKQTRFVRNAIINELNNPEINNELLNNIVRRIDNSYGRTYDVANLTPDDYISEILRWSPKGTTYEQAKKHYEWVKQNPEHLKSYQPINKNYYFDRAYRELYRSGALDNIPVSNTSTDMINKKVDELVINDILKANNGEIPMEILRENSPLAQALGKRSPSESDYNAIINAITKHGGAGITRKGNIDGRIYISGNPDLVSSKNVSINNMEPIANMIAEGRVPQPTINYDKQNLKVEPIKQINTSLSVPANNITKQPTKVQPKIEQSVITPKQVDVPLGARLYDARLNPRELAKIATDPKVLSNGMKTIEKIMTDPRAYLNVGKGLVKGILAPENVALMASDYLVHKASEGVNKRLENKYNIKSQAEFNRLYPTLSAQERGQLGYTYPEMYQVYMRGR